MNDTDLLNEVFKGDRDAVRLALRLAELSHIWDDLVDGDKPCTPERINRAFWLALVQIPANPFYDENRHLLRPVMVTSIVNWEIANQYERMDDAEKHALAHVMRYAVADMLLLMAFIIGGKDWVTAVGPRLRAACQKDTLDHYLSERKGAPDA